MIGEVSTGTNHLGFRLVRSQSRRKSWNDTYCFGGISIPNFCTSESYCLREIVIIAP